MIHNAERALQLLRLGTGLRGTMFRHGQEDAIRHIIENRGRLLVVQKTGWGKSFVYFIATKLLREQGAAPRCSYRRCWRSCAIRSRRPGAWACAR